jgi:hypothetical protein
LSREQKVGAHRPEVDARSGRKVLRRGTFFSPTAWFHQLFEAAVAPAVQIGRACSVGYFRGGPDRAGCGHGHWRGPCARYREGTFCGTRLWRFAGELVPVGLMNARSPRSSARCSRVRGHNGDDLFFGISRRRGSATTPGAGPLAIGVLPRGTVRPGQGQTDVWSRPTKDRPLTETDVLSVGRSPNCSTKPGRGDQGRLHASPSMGNGSR